MMRNLSLFLFGIFCLFSISFLVPESQPGSGSESQPTTSADLRPSKSAKLVDIDSSRLTDSPGVSTFASLSESPPAESAEFPSSHPAKLTPQRLAQAVPQHSLVLGAPSTAYEVLHDPGLDMSQTSDRMFAAAQIRSIAQARKERALAQAKALGLATRIEKPGGGLIELYDFEGNQPVYREIKNVNAAISTGADVLQAAPYNLDGSGLTVGIWDGGMVLSSHQEFSGGRVSIGDEGGFTSAHATNLAGTIGAAGVVPEAKGMATNTGIFSYNWNEDTSEMIERAAFQDAQFNDKIYISNIAARFLSLLLRSKNLSHSDA